MRQLFYRMLIELTNKRWSSAILKRFARSKVSRLLIPGFAKVYQLNENEMEQRLHEYPTLHDLFIRQLKKEYRTIERARDAVVSPVDAVIEDVGLIKETSEILVKGKTYSVEEMLGGRESLEKYLNGTYVILYLSPSHYHRIHSPIDGTVIKQWKLGSHSYPVNRLGLKYGVRQLSKNYRVITEVKTPFGHAAIVKVGAMFVNSIEITHKGTELKKGEEIAYFSFGSTVILLFENSVFQLEASLRIPQEIKVGERIGTMQKNRFGSVSPQKKKSPYRAE